MNYSKQFIRKIIYIVAIAVLLIPLSLIGRPSTRDADNAIKDSGGVLAQMRNEEDLSLSGLSQIDPAGETMKLASLGLRGLAVNLLWMQAIEAKQKKEYDDMTATLNTLVKLQPNFVKVWEYQAHNLSYNVSVEFDDYEYRYSWIKKGINFLTEGIGPNRRDHRILDSLGFITGTKFGTADERLHYRRLFRKDDQFHGEMDEFINAQNLMTPYDPDNWLLAYEWYRLSEELVDQGDIPLRRKEMIFYNNRPAQLRNLMLSLQKEKRVEEEYAKKTWGEAHKQWMEYGRRPITSINGLEYNLEGLGQDLAEMDKLRGELDELVPGVRDDLWTKMVQRASAVNSLSSEEAELLKLSLDELTDEQRMVVRAAETKLFNFNRRLEFDIAEKAADKDRQKAMRLANNIYKVMGQMRLADQEGSVINYRHWRFHTLAESKAEAVQARQTQFDASELRRKSILDHYAEIDPITNEKKTYDGAIQEYEKAFSIWADILREYPELKDGPLIEDLMDEMMDYESIRQTAGLVPYIRNHPLQFVIDERALRGKADGMLTSREINELLDDLEIEEASKELSPRPNIDFSLEADAPAQNRPR